MLTDFWSDLAYRVRALLRRGDVERELDEELRFHLEREAEKYAAQGVPRAEAFRRARLALGGVERTKEESRDTRGTVLLETFGRDVQYALRTLRRTPGFTVVAVICLALGIGATSTVFGIVDALFFRPPPGVGAPNEIVRPYVSAQSERLWLNGSFETSYPMYRDLRAASRSLAGLAGYADVALSVGEGAQARRANGLMVSDNYFSVLRVRPALGRFLAAEDNAGPGAAPVAVVSYAYWRAQLGGDPGVIGTQITLDARPYTVVGVAPAGFHGIDPGAVDMWVPVAQARYLGFAADQLETNNSTWFQLVGRLAPGVTREDARAELTPLITRELRQGPWGVHVDPRVQLGPILEARGPSPSSQATIARWLALAAALVLLIACANVANLLLARARVRRKEIGLRLSLGAGRARVVRQLLTESVVLAAGGTALGLLLARWGTNLVPAVGLPALSFLAHGRVLLFATAAALACVMLFGVTPAIVATRAELASTLKEGAREGADRRSPLRAGLMVAQVALATVLLVGAGLFVHSLRNVQQISTGMDVEHLLVGQIDFQAAGYSDTAATQLLDRAVERLQHTAGVRGATLSSIAPLSGSIAATSYSVPDGTSGTGGSIDLQGAMTGARALTVTGGPDYFSTVGTPIVAGREFTERDRAGSAPVVIVNQAFAEHEWPHASALGRCVDIGWKEDVQCYRVVGVAGNAKYAALEEPQHQAFFRAAGQTPDARLVLVRTSGDPAAAVTTVRRTLAELDPHLPYVNVKTLKDVLRPQLQPRRLGASMFGVFGLLALVLAAVGLYGVVSYAVAQRTHELGVRMALGAQRGAVLRLVVRQGVLLTLAGLALGVPAAFALSKFVAHLLYGVAPSDAVTFVGVAVTLALVAIAASLIPAARAARVGPMVALRAE